MQGHEHVSVCVSKCQILKKKKQDFKALKMICAISKLRLCCTEKVKKKKKTIYEVDIQIDKLLCFFLNSNQVYSY